MHLTALGPRLWQPIPMHLTLADLYASVHLGIDLCTTQPSELPPSVQPPEGTDSQATSA